MDIMKEKWKKVLERRRTLKKETKAEEKRKVKEGCFAVYVGPEKQRFIIKIEFANHPLFKMLLDDAVLEYGYDCTGPILIPCDVDMFCKVFLDIINNCCSGGGGGVGEDEIRRHGVGCAYGVFLSMSPSRRCGGGSGGYRRMFKLNGF